MKKASAFHMFVSRSDWINATGQCLIERYLSEQSATMMQEMNALICSGLSVQKCKIMALVYILKKW